MISIPPPWGRDNLDEALKNGLTDTDLAVTVRQQQLTSAARRPYDQHRAGIYRHLHLPEHAKAFVLGQLLANQAPYPGLGRAVTAVHRLLDLADTQSQPVRLRNPMPAPSMAVTDS